MPPFLLRGSQRCAVRSMTYNPNNNWPIVITTDQTHCVTIAVVAITKTLHTDGQQLPKTRRVAMDKPTATNLATSPQLASAREWAAFKREFHIWNRSTPSDSDACVRCSSSSDCTANSTSQRVTKRSRISNELVVRFKIAQRNTSYTVATGSTERHVSHE